MKIVLVVPAYNEAENIAEVIAEIRALYPALDLIVVDDGSSDSTAEIAASGGADVLCLPFNLGYGAAVQTGLIYAYESGFEACVLLDGDGQHDPRYIAALIEPIARGEADFVLGSRFLGEAIYDIPISRKVGMKFFSHLTSLITHQKITDPTSGFQAISRNLMRFFASDNYPSDFPDADTIIRLFFAGFRVKEVPVTIRPRLRGESMHSRLSILYYIYKMIFSILVALTERGDLREGGRNAIHDTNTDSYSESAAADDDHKPRAAKTTR